MLKKLLNILRKLFDLIRKRSEIEDEEEMEDGGYRCDVCGEITTLKYISLKSNIEVYQCPSCGSQIIWKYGKKGVTKKIWDNIHLFQYSVFYDYNYLIDKNGDVAIFWRADKLR